MRKILSIITMILIMFSVAVSAIDIEEGGRLVNTKTNVYDFGEDQDALFTVAVPKLTEYEVRAKWTSSSISYVPDELGNACNVGDYITLLGCTDPSGSSCVRAQSVDNEKTYTADRLKMSTIMSYTWWDSFKSGKYIGYECRVPKSTTTTTNTGTTTNPPATSDPTKFGVVTYVQGPGDAAPGETVTVNARYKALVTGTFVFECTFDQTKRAPLSIITSSQSSCDTSRFVAGKKINGVAGAEYSFQYSFLAPTTEGSYPLTCYAWTDCYDNGGQFINAYVVPNVPVKQKLTCNLLAGAQAVFEGTKNIISSWTTNQVLKYAPGCELKDLENFCGTKDQDEDGIPDNCDYCPQNYGDMENLPVGCHPCWGKAATSTCWDQYADEYGIPTQVYNTRNPVIGTKDRCNVVAIQTCVERKDGTLEQCETTEFCPSKCSTETNKCIAVEDRIEKVTFEECGSDGNVHNIVHYSNGTTIELSTLKECKYGCEDSECNPAPNDQTVNGGQDQPTSNNDGVTSVTTTDNTIKCTSDKNCPPGTACDSQTSLCVEYYPTLKGCTSNSACSEGEECDSELGLCIELSEKECEVDADCGTEEGNYCAAAGFCYYIEPFPIINSTEVCTESRIQVCEDGSEIIESACIGGFYQRLDNYCPEFGPTPSPLPSPLVDFPDKVTKPTIYIPGTDKSISPLAVMLVGLAVILAFIYWPKGKKGKKKGWKLW